MNLLGLSFLYLQGDGYKTMSLHTIGLQQFFSLESKLLQLIEWSVEGGGERGGGGREAKNALPPRLPGWVTDYGAAGPGIYS